jgi:hypothetical protein
LRLIKGRILITARPVYEIVPFGHSSEPRRAYPSI